MMDILIAGLQAGVGAAILRNVMGYFRVAMQDGELSPYELKRLGATVVSCTLFGVACVMMGMTTEGAIGLAAMADIGTSAMKKNLNVKK